jgi:hypothetical protein
VITQIVVTNVGLDYAVNDTITIDGTQFGGTTPADNVVLNVVKLINSKFSTIGGGFKNTASSYANTISGGYANSVSAYYGTIGGGQCNSIALNGDNGTIGGGQCNRIALNGDNGTIGGGQCNRIQGGYSTIGGGAGNLANGNYSFIGGGQKNSISADYSAILGGRDNGICSSSVDSFIIGSCINTNRSCTTFVNNLSIVDLPTSSLGLPSKSLYYDATSCVVFFVP